MDEDLGFPANDLSGLIGLIYDTAGDEELWPSLLQAMARYLAGTDLPVSEPVPAETAERLVSSWFGANSMPALAQGTAAERQVFAQLAPHFVRAFDMRQRLHASEAHRQLLEGALDRLPLGVALVERSGTVVSLNRAMLSLLHRGQGLALRAGRIESHPRKTLEDALRGVFGTTAGMTASTAGGTALRLGGERATLSVLVSRLDDGEAAQHALVWAASEDMPQISERGLQALYGVTPAEARLIQRLMRGATLEEAAAQLGISIHTVRSQLRSVFAKVGVQRQSELVQAVYATPLWLETVGAAPPAGPARRPDLPPPAAASARDGRLRLDDGRCLAWSDSGDPDGLPVILMHGLSCSRHLRHPDTTLLERAAIRLIIPERPGTGDSDPLPGRQVSDWPRDVQALADHLGLARFAVLSHSAGAPYAYATARALAPRVRALVMASATPPIERIDDIKVFSAQFRMAAMVARFTPSLLPPLLRLVIRGIRKDVYRYLDQIIRKMPAIDRAVFDDAGLRESYARELLAGVRQGDQHLVSEAMVNVHGWQLDDAPLPMPVALLHGGQDSHIAIEGARRLAARLPGARLREFPEGGHYLIFSHWPAILQALHETAGTPPGIGRREAVAAHG